VHLRFRAAPVWLSTAIPPSEPCAVSPLAARIISSSLVPMPEVRVVLPDREHQAQRSKPTALSRRRSSPPSPAKRIDQLFPWNWKPADETRAAARTGAFTERLLCFPPRPRNSTSGSRNIACLSTREACCTLHPRMLMARCWHVRDVTPAAARAAAIKGGADIPARTPFMLRPRCRTLRALSCSDPLRGLA